MCACTKFYVNITKCIDHSTSETKQEIGCLLICSFIVGAFEMVAFTAFALFSFSHISVLFYQIMFPLHSHTNAKFLKWVHLIIVIAGQPRNSIHNQFRLAWLLLVLVTYNYILSKLTNWQESL